METALRGEESHQQEVSEAGTRSCAGELADAAGDLPSQCVDPRRFSSPPCGPPARAGEN